MYSHACTATLSGHFTGCPQGERWACGRSDLVFEGPIQECNKILYKVMGIFSISNAQQLLFSYQCYCNIVEHILILFIMFS